MSERQEPLLEVVDLRTHFRTPRGIARAVDGISFSLDHGRMLGIVGESGSGKSVLSRSIIDILTHDGSVVYEGQVFLEGRDLRQLTRTEMRRVRGREIAMIFQDPMSSLNPVKKIGSQITEVLTRRRGYQRSSARERAIELLASVGIADPERQLNLYPMHFSGGMRQRVAIAIALAGEPKLLIADEPTTALDVSIQEQILNLLKRLQIENNMAVMLVTHDLGIVSRYTDEVAVMYAGQIVESCPTDELIRQPLMPYTEALMKAVPALSSPSHSRLYTIPGLPPDLMHVPKGCRFHQRCSHARTKCEALMPSLSRFPGSGHLYACWYPLTGAETVCGE